MLFLLLLVPSDQIFSLIVDLTDRLIDSLLILLADVDLIFLNGKGSTISLVMSWVMLCSFSRKLERVVR